MSRGSNSRLSATIETLQQNAHWLQIVRQHFAETGAFEVMTPALSCAAVTDPHIESLALSIAANGAGMDTHYLHTSPEYAMKRLLVQGSGDIYQICRVFRADEAGSLHNPEFTMLEWYRVGQDHKGLQEEVDSLLVKLWAESTATPGMETPPTVHLSYIEAIEKACDTPFPLISAGTICQNLNSRGIDVPKSMNPVPEDALDTGLDDWLDLLLTLVIIPGFKKDRFTCLSDYPASQAALAKISQNDAGVDIAERFEFFFGDVELANGYHELQDADEHRARFEKDLLERHARGLEKPPIDSNFLNAIGDGLPDCAGVALGLERLFMILAGKDHISEVMAFGFADA